MRRGHIAIGVVFVGMAVLVGRVYVKRGPTIVANPGTGATRPSLAPSRSWRISQNVESIGWSPSGSSLALLTTTEQTGGHGLVLWSPATGEVELTLAASEDGFHGVAWTPDAGSIIVGRWWDAGDQEDAWRFDLGTRERAQAFVGSPRTDLGLPYSSDVITLATAPNGRTLAAGTKLVDRGLHHGAHIGGEVMAWNLASGDLLWSDRTTHTNAVDAVVFSSDARLMASGGRDMLVRVWESETGKLVRTLHGAAWDGVHSLSFSPDDRLLASGGSGREEGAIVRVWDVESGAMLHQLSNGGFLPEWFVSVDFAPDGRLYAAGRSAADRGLSRLCRWDLARPTSVELLLESEGAVAGMQISPDGARVALATWEGDVLLLETDSGEK